MGSLYQQVTFNNCIREQLMVVNFRNVDSCRSKKINPLSRNVPPSVFTRLTSVNFTHQWGSPLVHNIKHPLTFIAQLALTIRGLDTKLCCCYSFSSFSSENLLKRILKCSLLASSHEMDELLSTHSLMG